MTALRVKFWQGWGAKLVPFGGIVTAETPLPRLARLALFQLSVGFAASLIIGTLNRVMIVELHVQAWLVSLMISLPLLLAPGRAIIGFKSDQHRSAFGWKRLPYLWFGTLAQFGGLAIMPFALIVLSGDSHAPHFVGPLAASLAFLLVGGGMHTTQTAGLALATDLARPDTRPKVVGMLCVMLLIGICVGALSYGFLLRHFSEFRLIQVVQGSALLTMLINGTGMWQQEPRSVPSDVVPPAMAEVWRKFKAQPQAIRRLVTIALGTMALSMQDILLEPYGGQVLHLTVSQTTLLTAALAGGGMLGLALAAKRMAAKADAYGIAAIGLLVGLAAFAMVIFSGSLNYPPMFVTGVLLIGLAAGMFLAGTLSDAMGRASAGNAGLALGTWGSVQAGAAGISIAIGGFIRDGAGYDTVYTVEILLIFVTLAALGPLVRRGNFVSLQPQT